MPSSQCIVKQSVEDGRGGTPYLPEEIIRNILKRLPVKFLIRFKCVCKHWKNLFKTPSFIEDHLHHSTHLNPALLLPWRHLKSDKWHLDLLDRDMELHELKNPRYSSRARVIGSSNGLICLKIDDDDRYSHSLILWNPATREFRHVPRTINDCKRGHMLRFGFISTVDDCKILRIYVLFKHQGYYGVNRVELYSLSTGSWKEVEFGNLKAVGIFWGTLTTNGAMFWFGYNVDGSHKSKHPFYNCIVSFDTAKEVFKLIPVLPDVDGDEILKLTEYENKLAAFSLKMTGEYQYCFKLWVIIEDDTGASGERWNWSKRWVKNYTNSLCPGLLNSYPRTIWRNTIVCVPYFRVRNDEAEKTLYLLNITTNEVKRVHVCRCWFDYLFNYVESLVSVGDIQVERKTNVGSVQVKRKKVGNAHIEEP